MEWELLKVCKEIAGLIEKGILVFNQKGDPEQRGVIAYAHLLEVIKKVEAS